MFNYFAPAATRLVGWAATRLFQEGVGLKDRLELRRLNRLDEPALFMEIARADNAPASMQKREDLIQYGRKSADRLLPKARSLICPHRQKLLTAVDFQGEDVIAGVFQILCGNVPTSLAKPLAALIVKNGLNLLCDTSGP